MKPDYPLRKPLCIVVVLFALGLCAASFIMERDILEGPATILTWLVPLAIAGYYCTSTIEHCKDFEKWKAAWARTRMKKFSNDGDGDG